MSEFNLFGCCVARDVQPQVLQLQQPLIHKLPELLFLFLTVCSKLCQSLHFVGLVSHLGCRTAASTLSLNQPQAVVLELNHEEAEHEEQVSKTSVDFLPVHVTLVLVFLADCHSVDISHFALAGDSEHFAQHVEPLEPLVFFSC